MHTAATADRQTWRVDQADNKECRETIIYRQNKINEKFKGKERNIFLAFFCDLV